MRSYEEIVANLERVQAEYASPAMPPELASTDAEASPYRVRGRAIAGSVAARLRELEDERRRLLVGLRRVQCERCDARKTKPSKRRWCKSCEQDWYNATSEQYGAGTLIGMGIISAAFIAVSEGASIWPAIPFFILGAAICAPEFRRQSRRENQSRDAFRDSYRENASLPEPFPLRRRLEGR